MVKKKVFVCRRIPAAALQRLSSEVDLTVWPAELPPSRAELLQHVEGCDGILSLLSDRMDAEVFQQAGPQLRVVSNYAVGFNNIDVREAHSRGIRVGNTPGVLTEATADIAAGLILATARRFSESIDQVRNLEWKTWDPLGLLGLDLKGATLGIVGMGRIGMALAKRMHFGWDMNVIHTARTEKPDAESLLNAKRVDLATLLANADVVSLHADYNPTTHHLINSSTLAMMKPNAILINTARGGLIDQDALYNALKDGTIWGAGLDVTDPEPLPDDSQLRTLPQCLILPHIGSATIETRQAMADIAVDNLLAGLHGRPLPHEVRA
jgi:glyoxylate reductase